MTVKRKWYTGHRLIYDGKRKVICAECPCDQGCRYTYYVDHSRSESGDGHSWETAFKSVNDVFNSLEIRNYRMAGCVIYVKIRGTVSYQLTGTYLSTSSSYAYVYLQPESESGSVACTLNARLFGIYGYAVRIVFENWNFSIVATTAEGSILYRISYLNFSNCHFSVTVYLDLTGYYYLFRQDQYVTISGCSFDITFAQSVESPSVFSGWFRFSSTDSYLTMDDTSIHIGGSSPSNGSYTFRISMFASNSACLISNVAITWNFSVLGVQGGCQLWGVEEGSSSIYDSVSFNYADMTVSLDSNYPNAWRALCCFKFAGSFGENVFYNCTQSCEIGGAASSTYCDTYCQDLA